MVMETVVRWHFFCCGCTVVLASPAAWMGGSYSNSTKSLSTLIRRSGAAWLTAHIMPVPVAHALLALLRKFSAPLPVDMHDAHAAHARADIIHSTEI